MIYFIIFFLKITKTQVTNILPVAYIGFIRLQGSKDYLGDDLPRGAAGTLWRAGMVLSTAVLVTFLSWFAWTNVPGWIEAIGS
ncbi:MAG: hypothetical protein ABGY42_09520 [bacterium]